MEVERERKLRRGRDRSSGRNWIIWGLVVILSALAIVAGNRVATQNLNLFVEDGSGNYKGTVTRILEAAPPELAGDPFVEDIGSNSARTIYFKAEVKAGPHKGETIIAEQVIDERYINSQYLKEVEAGDSVLLYMNEGLPGEGDTWYFSDYYRFDKIVVLGLIFVALVLLLGRWKGVNTLISMIFTLLFVFLVFVPAVMSGENAYLAAIITCLYTVVMTLLLVIGPGRKTFATIIGCVGGTAIAALCTSLMKGILRLTGFLNDESVYLTLLNPDKPLDLTAIIFAAILIGAIGAIMDVAMDIASALYELCEHVPDITFQKLFQSGMSIGRDIMGTMANTLVLAYIGSSLSSIMLLLTYSTSVLHLLNREVIVVECLQALIGSLAILLTIPLTVLACGALYLGQGSRGRRLSV
ncbi:MAG: YibE/F family protein [Firmicutes bacterium]|nr:YibE/F family protein [Bacillota bacterium]